MSMSVWSLLLASAENFILINGALSVLPFIVATLARSKRVARDWPPLSLSRLYAAALILPPLVSIWIVCASLLPAAWLGAGQWAQEHQAPHANHLLNTFTAPVDPVLGYGALAFALLAMIAAVYVAVSGYVRIGRIVRRLEIGTEPAAPERIKQVEDMSRRHGIDVGLVMSSYPFSFVWGYLRSKLVVSTGLLNALTDSELAALLEHEAAHHVRRDNLLKWVLTVCRYVSPAYPLTRLLYRWWSEQVEMVCDEIAARRTCDPVEVAGALTRLRRLTLNRQPRKLHSAGAGFLGDEGEGFERRVLRVLSLADRAETGEVMTLSHSWVRDAVLVGAGFALSLIVLFKVSPLAIHRAIEAILRVF